MTRIDRGVAALATELRGHVPKPLRNWSSGRRSTRSAKFCRKILSGARLSFPATMEPGTI